MSKKTLSLHRILNHRPLVPVVKLVRFGTDMRASYAELRQATWVRR